MGRRPRLRRGAEIRLRILADQTEHCRSPYIWSSTAICHLPLNRRGWVGRRATSISEKSEPTSADSNGARRTVKFCLLDDLQGYVELAPEKQRLTQQCEKCRDAELVACAAVFVQSSDCLIDRAGRIEQGRTIRADDPREAPPLPEAVFFRQCEATVGMLIRHGRLAA
jgi:hypothetical protein